jgi:pimeloyl-ACP methyl ester carboxylesterase
MAVMARRLRLRGHCVQVFSYPTRSNSLEEQADELYEFIDKDSFATLHLVGHSMGGLLILNMLSRFDQWPPGRVVLMGCPVAGSGVVRRLEKMPGQKLLFGHARDSLLEGFRYTPRQHETGMIRGTRSVGLGRLAGQHCEPNDGTVALSETQLDGLKDSIELPVSHSQMLINAGVAEQVEQFLLHGKFKSNR